MLERADNSEDIDCILLSGVGDFFSAGADLKDISILQVPLDYNDEDTDIQHSDIKNTDTSKLKELPVIRFMRKIIWFSKIICVAVNGPAIGIFATLLVHCDLCYASESAYLWTPFFRLGIAPEFGSSRMFPSLLGRSRATEMLMLGSFFFLL